LKHLKSQTEYVLGNQASNFLFSVTSELPNSIDSPSLAFGCLRQKRILGQECWEHARMMYFINWIFTAILALRNRLAQSTQKTGSDCVGMDPLPNQGCSSCQGASSLTRIIGAIILTPALILAGVFPLGLSEVKNGKYLNAS